MSELREKLLGPRNIRSQIIKVVVLSVVLVTAFAFSVALFNLVFGSLRETPSSPIDEADEETLLTTPIPFPWDIMDLLSLLQSLGIDIDQDLLESLMDMYDGDFDDIPLDELAALMAAMMFSDVEVFRVYNYDSLSEMEDVLWKYECFDKYDSGSWSSNTPDLWDLDPYSYSEFLSTAADPDPTLLKVKMLNITPSTGLNQFTIPNIFSAPYFIENSFEAQELDNTSINLKMQADGLNGTSFTGIFNNAVQTNFTYQIGRENPRTDDEINTTCVLVTSPLQTYIDLIDSYRLFYDGADISNYILNHDDFAFHYNYLNDNVINAGDTAFIIADKIRNYLQYNFNLSYTDSGTEDPIEWFFETQEGMYSDFAAAFCALARAFDVPSRFVDGFNSRFIEQFWDNNETAFGFAVKYRNMYSWAEIFIPTSSDGSTGYWAQIDTYYENYMGNPPVPVFGDNNFTIDVETNYTATLNHVNRGDIVNVTATLLNNTLPMVNTSITFTDETTGDTLGVADTNDFGKSSISIDITNGRVVGPHIISAQYNPQTINATYYIINDTISINLTSLINVNLMPDPQVINVSQANNDTIRVQGYVYDPINGERVKYTNLNFSLFLNGSSIPIANPFTPSETTADSNGDFIVDLEADSNIFPDLYEVTANSDGTWNYTLTIFGQPIDIPIPMGGPPSMVQNSSQRLNLIIERDLMKYINFYIDNIPSDNAESPIVGRDQLIELKAIILNESMSPIMGENVSFYNYSNNQSYFMGWNTTDLNGETTYNYSPGVNATIGPNLLYARLDSFYNYSYYALSDQSNITITGYSPVPFVVNKSKSEEFTITGFLVDGNNSKPLANCDVSIRIFDRYGVEYTSYLTNSTTTFVTNSTGGFQRTFGVDSSIPVGNFTVTLEFNGSFNDYTTNPYYPYYFNIPSINTSYNMSTQLQITYDAPLYLNFYINGTDSSDYNNPIIYRNGDVNLTARIILGVSPMSGYNVSFYDSTQGDIFIGSDVTDINGFATIIYNTDASTIAGSHLLYAKYGNTENYSYFILNAPINISFTQFPNPSTVNCTGSYGRTFVIQGYLNDSLNGAPIKYGEISVHLFNGPVEITPLSTYLSLQGGSYQLNETGEIYLLYNVESPLTAGNYTIKIYYNGTFLYSAPNNVYNEHNFYLTLMSNFSISESSYFNLTVLDPQDILIDLSVDGNATAYSGTYSDANPPQKYNRGDTVHIQVNITQQGSTTNVNGTVRLYNDYNGTLLDSHTFVNEEGDWQFDISTSSYHPGLYRFRVEFYTGEVLDRKNYTYIIINESVTIDHNIPAGGLEIIRGTTISQSIIATVTDPLGYSGTIEGLQLNLTLLDSNLVDVSHFLVLQGTQPITILGGSATFTINSILQSCPYGKYYLRIDFNGSLAADWLLLADYMLHSNSSLITLNVTANTYFNSSASYFNTNFQPTTPTVWIDGDTLHVFGQLLWDNGTGISNVYVTLTIIYRSNSSEIASNVTVSTNFNGNFDGIIQIDESFNGIVDISDSIISISFDPKSNGLAYVESPVDEVYN